MNILDMAPALVTRNITRVFRAATDQEAAEGLAWYADAHGLAGDLAAAHGYSLLQAAGVLAATSPNNSWGANVNLTRRILAAGGLDSGYLRTGLRKANLILRGTDPATVLTSQKVAAFYDNIVMAGKSDRVTVDRHALSVALGERSEARLTARQYGAVADAYRRAARALSKDQGRALSAPEVQAVTWVAWRHRTWAVGAFDPR